MISNFSESKGGYTVLIVEDEEAVQSATKMLLEMSGFKVMTADNGIEALDVFSYSAKSIDVVLLDYSMPLMSGLETLKSMLALNPAARIIVISGYDSQGPVKEMLNAGAVASLQKPFRVYQLISKIKSVLSDY